MAAHEDQKYVEALLNNNSALIGEIYKKCSHQCTSFIKKNSGTLAEANDIFQEAITTLYYQAKRGLILTAPVCAYLFRIYRGKWLNLLKKKKRKKEATDLINWETSGFNNIVIQPVEENSFEETQEKIFMDCFAKLSNSAKQLFDLRYKDKKSAKEIAKRLGIEDNTVNQRFSYYKKTLKDCVEKHPDFKN